MYKILPLFVFVLIFSVVACTPQTAETSASSPTIEPTVPIPTQALPTVSPSISPVEADQSTDWKFYQNSALGLGFQYPSSWFGPDETISDQDLRVAVGSDIVYPYGTDRLDQIYKVKNSYYVVIQYSKNNQNQYWKDIYQLLSNMQDGESFSDGRSITIRERLFNLGSFTGFEYITTLSETAQTEPVYIRTIILFDMQSNLLVVTGSPNNVEIGDGVEWREVYQMVDNANAALFHEIAGTITIE